MQRTIGQAGQHAAQVRDHLFHLTQLQRHHVVLELNARSGLLTWEALRRVPEGAVYTQVPTAAAAQALQKQALALPALQQPVIVTTGMTELTTAIAAQSLDLKFDWIVGRNVGIGVEGESIATQLRKLLRPQGQVVLAETMPSQGQRLYDLLNPNLLDADLYQRWVTAETALYDPEQGDLRLNWNINTVKTILSAVGLEVQLELERSQFELYVTEQLLERWFVSAGERVAYGDQLQDQLSSREVEEVRSALTQALLYQTVSWTTSVVYVTAHDKSGEQVSPHCNRSVSG